MRAFVTLVRRELSAFFCSWIGYVLLTSVLLLLGATLVALMEPLNNVPTDRPATELYFGTLYFWIILVPVAPFITMRSFAHEKSTGTMETLMTAPVGDLQVVLAKFSGSWLFFMVLWLPLLACLGVLRHYSDDASVMDLGSLLSTYAGLCLIGSAYMAAGCFASALTRNQVIAVMIGFAIGLGVFLLNFVRQAFQQPEGWRRLLVDHLSLVDQMEDFATGVVDTRPVALYLSLTVFFLLLAWKVVESRRWK